MSIYLPHHLPSQPFLYVVGWSNLDTWYLGVRYAKHCHSTDLWTSYFTSSDYVREFRERNGEPDHIEILLLGDREEVLATERAVITEFNLHLDPKWLNRSTGAIHISGQKFQQSEAFRKQRSEAQKARWQDPEFRQSVVSKMQGRTLSQETKRLIREKRAKQVITPETRQKLSDARTGRKLSPSHIANSAAARRGSKRSEEWKAQHSIRMKGNGKGVPKPGTSAKLKGRSKFLNELNSGNPSQRALDALAKAKLVHEALQSGKTIKATMAYANVSEDTVLQIKRGNHWSCQHK
ncbi:NUMOD3 domain-containing DNA-binding protein [Sphingobium yanoikuyae]|jgi:hypothetical protein|uniref:NUMOD3 domain-containing DNA-binding protein n=1 Tax=Sphingobium yanoikuyae TaxID=13690 RepID=UPI000AD5BBD5|nr:NUMOD3 domain-containing DNA-binding protein [Sphingobium yanoikuyae]